MNSRTRKEFDIPLSSRGDVIRVRIVRDRATVVDFVVQCETLVDGQRRAIVRYDGSHGRPHRDLLGWNGETFDKRWSPDDMSHNEALTAAIDDIEANWRRYLDEFLRRRP